MDERDISVSRTKRLFARVSKFSSTLGRNEESHSNAIAYSSIEEGEKEREVIFEIKNFDELLRADFWMERRTIEHRTAGIKDIDFGEWNIKRLWFLCFRSTGRARTAREKRKEGQKG